MKPRLLLQSSLVLALSLAVTATAPAEEVLPDDCGEAGCSKCMQVEECPDPYLQCYLEQCDHAVANCGSFGTCEVLLYCGTNP